MNFHFFTALRLVRVLSAVQCQCPFHAAGMQARKLIFLLKSSTSTTTTTTIIKTLTSIQARKIIVIQIINFINAKVPRHQQLYLSFVPHRHLHQHHPHPQQKQQEGCNHFKHSEMRPMNLLTELTLGSEKTDCTLYRVLTTEGRFHLSLSLSQFLSLSLSSSLCIQ